MLRLAARAVIVALAGPVIAGFLFVLLSACGIAPALGRLGIDGSAFVALTETPALVRSILLSLASGILTPLVALLITILFLAAAHSSRSGDLLRRAVSPFLAVPHAAMAFGLAFLIAPSGLILRALSPWLTGLHEPPDLLIVNDRWGLAMMAGLVVKETPFLLLMSLSALPQVQAGERLAVAQTLGYRPVTAWLKAVAPALYPLIRLPVYAVVAYASSVVDVAMILGPTTPPTLGVAILRWANDPDLERSLVASAGALVQLAVSLSAIAIWWVGEAIVARLAHWWIEGGSRSTGDGALGVLGKVSMASVAGLSVVGLGALALWSVAGYWRFPELLPRDVTLEIWRTGLRNLTQPLENTAAIAALATVLALVGAIGALEHEVRRGVRASRTALTILYLPLLVPAVTFLLGLNVAAALAGIRPGFWPVVAGHVLFVLPYVYLSLSEAYWRHDPRWSAVARTLGARPAGVFWRVRLPMLLTPILAAAAVGVAVSIGQYLPTQVLGAGRVPTITTEAVALASGGDRRYIGVWALLQAVLPAVGFILATALPRLIWRHRRAMRETRR
ncbi:MAG: ABC transporter permease subunit [Hyphomicrobiaceae bacterium]